MENINLEKDVAKLKSQRNVFIVIALILAIVSGFTIYKLLNTEKQVETLVVEKGVLNTEKTDLVAKLEKLNEEYSTLSEEYEGLDSVFQAEKAHIEQLMSDLKNKDGNIAKYKSKVANLEKRMKEFIAQIEELKAKNLELTTENISIKTALDSTKIENTELSKEKEVLTSQVTAGSVLKAYDISVEALKLKSNNQEMPTSKIKKVDKIRTCFVMSENAIAKSGKKTVYVRISDPDGVVISEGTDDAFSFEYQGSKIIYSAKEEINYNNKAMDVCIYWAKPRTYKPGTYYVDIFVDGANIGTAGFDLEK
ncbi:MAG: hypothetical protein WCK02_01225 [Bacteroidota bacterium]